MNSLTRTILYNAHLPSLMIGFSTVLSGLTASVLRGGVQFFPALMTLVFTLLLQTTANLYHGYFDLCYGSGENIAGSRDRDSRARNASRLRLLKVMADGGAILTVTAGLPLFSYIGWIGVGYVALILVMLYFYFAGPNPIVRTKWSVILTFLIFGPVGISGIVLVQDQHSSYWLPIMYYSIINGLMAVNAHISVQFLRYKEDMTNGKQSLLISKGVNFTRWVFLSNTLIVCLVLLVRRCVSKFVGLEAGTALAVALLVSSLVVFFKMKGDPAHMSRMVRSFTMGQYALLVLILMSIVVCSVDDFSVRLLY